MVQEKEIVAEMKKIKSFIQEMIWGLFHYFLEWKIRHIRKKEIIRFLFILQELSQWKTEMLYLAMLEHPRFEPILGIAPCIEYPGAEEQVIDYCRKKNYHFVMLNPESGISSQLKTDFLAHQKPYSWGINPGHRITRNLLIPTVSIPYYLSTITEGWLVNQRPCLLAWREFIDNESCAEEWRKVQRLHGKNYAVTGLPVMDEFISPSYDNEDPWPLKDCRKRIVYAPHHTIGESHLQGIAYSTFLEFGHFMLQMRDKYKEQVYFVFKPHPFLYQKLVSVWGKKKTQEYYNAWEEPGISHREENNKYISLFKHSDALIHDCGSFTIEYMYTGKPVMYLVRDSHHKDNLNRCATLAFDLHYKGKTRGDIEKFIQNVIADYDPLSDERSAFRDAYLTPPNNKTACDNIIDAVLGNNGYK